MEAKPLNLNGQEVTHLKEAGWVIISREVEGAHDPDVRPALHPAGTYYWVRERVARRHKNDPPGQWLYKADGYVAGRYYLASYYMLPEACRFNVVVTEESLLFLLNEGPGVWVSKARLELAQLPAEEPVYELDFEKIREYSGGRHKPIFAVAQLAKATDPEAEQDDLVRLHAYQGFGEWRLPLDNYDVRQWLKKLRFTQEPVLQFGPGFVRCGREVVAC